MPRPTRMKSIEAGENRTYSRRDLVKAGGALGVGATLMPWLRSGPDSLAAQSSGTPTGGEYHGYWPFTPPPVGHFNSFTVDSITMGIYQAVAELPLGLYRWDTEEFLPVLATKWELNSDGIFNVELRDGIV